MPPHHSERRREIESAQVIRREHGRHVDAPQKAARGVGGGKLQRAAHALEVVQLSILRLDKRNVLRVGLVRR